MSLLDGVRHVLRSVISRNRADDETREELAFHLQRQTEKHIADGHSPTDAARLAALELGGAQRWREETAATRRGGALFDIIGDTRLAVRALVARPAFAFSAIATTAIGIGAGVAIFALADGTLLRPLPFPDPARLMSVSLRMPRGATRVDMTWSYPKFVLFRDRQRVFSALALHSSETVVLSADDGAQRVSAEMASAELFTMLGASPLFGRTYTAAEDRIGGPSDVVVLSEGLWRSRFGGRRDAIGDVLTVSGKKRTVIGVMPADFRGLSGDAQLWLPILGRGAASWPRAAGAHNMELLARLNDGVSPTTAKLATDALGTQIDAAYPDVDGHWGAAAYELNALRVNPAITRSIRLLAIAVALVVAIVCVNLGTLLLTRSAGRRRELAIRAALGAGRGRLIRQLITESAALVAIGTIVGVGLGWSAVRVLALTLPLSAPTTSSGTDLTRLSFSDVGLTSASIVFALVIGAAMAIGIGFMSAARVTGDGAWRSRCGRAAARRRRDRAASSPRMAWSSPRSVSH